MKSKAQINVTKIKKELLFKGDKGTYLNITLIPNKDGRDQYGWDGFIAQEVSKEAYDRGEKGPIIGNFKLLESKPPQAKQEEKPIKAPNQQEDDIPFN